MIPNESVHLDSVNIVELLDGLLDVMLAGTDITDKDERIMIFNLAHGRFSVKGELQDGKLIQPSFLGDSLTGVLGGTGELEGLGEVETGAGVDLADGLGLGSTDDGLAGGLGLLDSGSSV